MLEQLQAYFRRLRQLARGQRWKTLDIELQEGLCNVLCEAELQHWVYSLEIPDRRMLDSTRLRLTDTTLHYLAAAIWSTTDDDDEPLEKYYGLDCVSEEFAQQAILDCGLLMQRFGPRIAAEGRYHPLRGSEQALTWMTEQAGIDFWLTRNGHGAGFGDGDWGPRGLVEDLIDYCLEVGEVGLCVVDGVIECH
jgi:hypothetical protein